jgi:hypothetical protein
MGAVAASQLASCTKNPLSSGLLAASAYGQATVVIMPALSCMLLQVRNQVHWMEQACSSKHNSRCEHMHAAGTHTRSVCQVLYAMPTFGAHSVTCSIRTPI